MFVYFTNTSIIRKRVPKIVTSIIMLMVISCTDTGNKENYERNSLTEWFLKNELNIKIATDNIYITKKEEEKLNPNWTSTTVVVTKYAPNVLGKFAQLISADNDCLAFAYTFFKDSTRKRIIEVFNIDSSCLAEKQEIHFDLDSTKYFILGGGIKY